MDKKGTIDEHSKIKLELYRLYLERYLSVLSAAGHFTNIEVIDIFAGCGISDNNEKGSAVIAAKAINHIQSDHPRQRYKLRLNDSDQKKCASLQSVLQGYDFIDITHENANEYIQQWRPSPNTHHLFFIDPHGYTQVSPDNLQRLFRMQHCDFLVFVPIYHIYRFLKPSDAANSDNGEDFLPGLGIDNRRRKVDTGEFCKPVAKFLSGLGINRETASKADNVEKFADMITEAFKRISKSPYAYSQMIKNKQHNSQYCLFFISHHILGAEKFLEAQDKLKKQIEKPDEQTTFDFVSDENQKSILNSVEYGNKYDNVSLYELGIKAGLRPTELTKELKHLEKNGTNKVQIEALPGQRRNRGGLYITYGNYKKKLRKISITFVKGGWAWENLQ